MHGKLEIVAMLAAKHKVAIAAGACLVVGGLACGRDADEVAVMAPTSAPGMVSVAAAAPSFGVAADYAPEHGGSVVMAGSYPVEVVPRASGEVYAYVLGDAPPPPRGTELAVVVPVTGGTRTVELAWDGGESRWAGRVRRAEIVPGPVDVVLVVDGSRWLGHAPTIVVLPAIVVAPTVVVETAPTDVDVIVVEEYRGKHRKHRKHRGRGRGHGGGYEIHFGH